MNTIRENKIKVELSQIEESDYPLLRDTLNQDFSKYLGFYKFVNTHTTGKIFDNISHRDDAYLFSIKLVRSGDFVKNINGFCYISNIDWISRHGELEFLMFDNLGAHFTIKNSNESLLAFKKLVSYAFNELNLNKVWLEVPSQMGILEPLEKMRFVAEGVRASARIMDGKQISTTIFSLLRQEFSE